MDKRPIEPLHVVTVWEGEQNLVGQNGDGEKQYSTHCNRQGEGTQPQPTKEKKNINKPVRRICSVQSEKMRT